MDRYKYGYWKPHKNDLHVLILSKCSWSKKIIHHEIPGKPWEVVGVDMFTLCNKKYLCIVDCHSKFQVIKKMEDLSADGLILACKIMSSEYGILKEMMSDAGGNFISDTFKTFCKNLNIEHAVSSLYYHQSNRQVEACIKIIKRPSKHALKLNLIHI